MAWTVRRNLVRLSTEGDAVFMIVESLLAAGWECYGSSNATSFDNAGAGATNYWVSATVAATTNAWIRLRAPVFDGVTRELRIQKTATARRWTIYWSPGSTYFTSGASASAAPTTPTAGDMQFVHNGSADFEPNLGSASSRHMLRMVTGNADEGHSFFAGIIESGATAPHKSLFLDVLIDSNSSDVDPAVYGAATETSLFGTNPSNTHSFFLDTAVGNNDSNIGGWYKKGTGEEAWVAYPIQCWGYMNGSGSALVLTSDNRSPDLPQGSNSSWRCRYGRAADQTFSTQLGYKGKSRLFRTVSSVVGGGKINSAKTLLSLGALTIPWDGTTYYT